MIQPQLKAIYSPDISDLQHYAPADPESFSILLQIFVTAEGYDSGEAFDVTLCTPQWLTEHYAKDDIIVGAHFLIAFEYNFANLVRRINKYLAHCSGETWEQVARKVGMLGKWEFEAYRPD